MGNLRLIRYSVIDSTTITLVFSDSLDSRVGVSNFSIISNTNNVPNGTVISTSIDENEITLTTLPLTPFAIYKLKLFSTDTILFKGINGDVLLEDGKTNEPFITGAPNPENSVLNKTLRSFKKTIYDVDNPGLVRNIIEANSNLLYKTKNTINQLRTDNYLSITQTDEYHVRGDGPYDRLGNEGAYEIINVSKYPNNFVGERTITVSSFPKEPITLQREIVQNEALTGGNSTISGTFNGITLNLKHNNITKVTSIIIIYQNSTVATYDLESYGFQLKDSRYDANASTYSQLNSNQVRFSQKALDNGLVTPVIGDRIRISYEYKNTGIDIDETTVVVSEVKQEIREVCPPIATIFSLQNNNITKSSGVIGSVGDIVFLDPHATPPFSIKHPAFKNEMVFSSEKLPSAPGYYSVDYTNGKVYVFGEDTTQENVGSGPFPPVCTYYYKKEYVEDLDYTYEPTLREVVANPDRYLIGKSIYIKFNYKETYVDGVDHVSQIHNEVLDERINNNLSGNNTIKPQYGPITNVFRIFNETTGEIYRINRFDDYKIYFNYTTPPAKIKVVDEKASFENIYDENLIKNDVMTTVLGLNVWKIPLLNNSIINSNEDAIASNINTSVLFSYKNTFIREAYYDKEQTIQTNINKLRIIGDYVIDYDNGIIYLAISATALPDIGTVSYKSKYIKTNHEHILSVDKIYSTLDLAGEQKDITNYDYNSFSDTKIDLLTYPISDNRYVSTDPDIPILIESDSTINLPVDSKNVRGVYDSYNLNTSFTPINFAVGSSTNFSIATLVPVEVITQSTVSAGLTVIVPEVQLNSNFVISSVLYIKKTDGTEIYHTVIDDGSFSGSIITLSSDTTGVVGETVNISIMLILKTGTAVVVDLDYGGLYVNYTSLYDEIIISYEYGDNVLDFRTSQTISSGDEYYISYKYGALRDALLANFGSSVRIPELSNFNVDLDRERYRDALMACFYTFPDGPTIGSIKDIAKIISHVEPEIIESMFEEWVLGSSRLYNNTNSASGTLMPGVWDYGIYFPNGSDYVKTTLSSHLKLDGGTIEFWVIPNWDGIDNDATLTFTGIKKDGYYLDNSLIFIGATGHNPTFEDGYTFSISKFDTPTTFGMPVNISTKQSGMFIYYDSNRKRWVIIGKDVERYTYYTGNISTSGEFYDVGGTLYERSDIRTTKNSNISFKMNLDGYDGYHDGYDGYVDGITWMSDNIRYLFDYGEDDTENRISIFKDGRGYLNLRVYSKKDKFNRPRMYQTSYDISAWKAGDKHHIAFSNKIGSKDKRDELHLFVDGFEVPNVLRFGGRPISVSTDPPRVVIPEVVAGVVPKNTIAANDLATTVGSNIVYSPSIDFGVEGIVPGDTIYIEEQGFASSYTILALIDFHTLSLSSAMPTTITNGVYSINKWTAPVSIELMYEPNLLVSRFDGISETELPGLRATVPAYAVSVDSYGQPSIVIRSGAKAGDQIYIRTLGVNRRRIRERMYLWDGYSSTITTNLPPPITLDYTDIYPVNKLRYIVNSPNPSYGNSDGTLMIAGNDTAVIGITPDTQPSDEIGGRTLSIFLSGGNIDFSVNAAIKINGTTWSGATSEIVYFTSTGIETTTEYFKTITSIDAYARAININWPICGFEIKEMREITYPENTTNVPILRYSQILIGNNSFAGSGTTITNSVISFYNSMEDKILVISSPAAVAGTYTITSVVDSNTIAVSPALGAVFTGGVGKIYDISISRSGFQNGTFVFEYVGDTPEPYILKQGYYDFDYASYLEIPFEFKSKYAFIGNDYALRYPSKAIIDEFRAVVLPMTDTRIGEETLSNGYSITLDYLKNKPFEADEYTSSLLHMDELPPVDSSIPYSRYSDTYLQASDSLNSEFDTSLFIKDKPFSIFNDFILFGNAGTIEFWFSPNYDSKNDNMNRYLFDANSAIVEETTSLTKSTVKLSSRARTVYRIQLQNDNTTNGTDYFLGGTLSSDRTTCSLGRELPAQQTPVKVIYTPYGLVGNRMSIYKDNTSVCRFAITADNKLYEMSTPVFWSRGTWHRIMASWDFTKSHHGEMHLFIDGEEKVIGKAGTFVAGSGFIAGNVGPNNVTTLNIKLKDQFQELFFGGNFLGGEIMSGRIDNVKISRIKKSPVYISGQPYDNDYSSNISSVLPVVEDLYTTYLMNFEKAATKIDDFTILKNKITGIYDFTIKIFDSFDIINNSARVKDILETLINTLKPARSRAFIKYIK